MDCLHPYCPLPNANRPPGWAAVLESPKVRAPKAVRPQLLAFLAGCGPLAAGGAAVACPPIAGGQATINRLFEECPCLYAQVQTTVSARGVVHLCEVTLNAPITSQNVYDAFHVQHPTKAPPFLFPPVQEADNIGGQIMEVLCSEVLTNTGVPHMAPGVNGQPTWTSSSHLSLNSRPFQALKLYGDILIPAAPHNILVSVKSEAARERFVVSGNRLESVGFGFFKHPSEFWTRGRINLLKRWGFIAVYMPAPTLTLIQKKLVMTNLVTAAINLNGNPLYRPLEEFGPDMARVAGRMTMIL